MYSNPVLLGCNSPITSNAIQGYRLGTFTPTAFCRQKAQLVIKPITNDDIMDMQDAL